MRVPDIVFHPCREPSPEQPPKLAVYRTGIRISLTPPPLRRHPPPVPPPPRRTRSADSRRHRSGDSSCGSGENSGRSSGFDSLSGSGRCPGGGGDLSGGSESGTFDRECPVTQPRSRGDSPNRPRPTAEIKRNADRAPRWEKTPKADSLLESDLRSRPAESGRRPTSGGPQRRPSRPPPPPPIRCFSVDMEDRSVEREEEEAALQPDRGRPRSWAGMELNADLLDGPRLLIGLPSEEDVRLAEKKKEEGNLSYTAKKYQQALDLYSQAIDLCPQCAAYHNNRSACLLMLGQYRQALNEAREAVRLDNKYVKGLLRVAKCQVILGDVAGADSALKQAAGLEPQNAGLATERRNMEAVARLTQELDLSWEKADYRRALFCVERALTVATGSCQLRVRRAECLVLLGRYQEAQNIVHDMLRTDSMNADALYVRGMCLYYQDEVDKAFNHFQQVLRLAPDHQRARQVYKQAKSLKAKKEEGNMAFKKGSLHEALKLYTEALEIDPLNKATNAKLYFNRATVQARLNSNQEAIADCTQAIELDSNYVKAYLRRAKCYMLTEQYEEAVRDYEKVNSLDRNHEHRRLLQEAKHELKKSKRKDYYKILNLGRTATTDEIKKAYRKQALVHHPDRHSNATEEDRKEAERRFKDVGEAYSVLSDRSKRIRYDNGQDLDDGDGFSSADVDHSNIFQAFFGGGGAAPGGYRSQAAVPG